MLVRVAFGFALLLCFVSLASAVEASPSDDACPRPQAGATATNPPELRSQNGILEVTLHFRYQRTVTGQGPQRYCYVTDRSEESPTLRVHPGDQLIIHFHNDLPATGLSQSQAAMAALREVESGYRNRAVDDADASLKLASNRDLQAMAALALARAGDTSRAEKIAAELDKSFPLDTLVQKYWLPV
jgi:hypothetical protein